MSDELQFVSLVAQVFSVQSSSRFMHPKNDKLKFIEHPAVRRTSQFVVPVTPERELAWST